MAAGAATAILNNCSNSDQGLCKYALIVAVSSIGRAHPPVGFRSSQHAKAAQLL
jgi:hypothetical protein